MASQQGLSGSIHAPSSSTSTDSPPPSSNKRMPNASKLRPANAFSFTPAGLPASRSTISAQAASTSKSPPVTPLDCIQHRNEAPVSEHVVQPFSEEDSVPAFSLQLTKAVLVHNSTALPNFSIDALLLERTGQGESFSVYNLAAGIAQNCSIPALTNYLDSFPRKHVRERINDRLDNKHPVLFYAAQRNSVDCIRLLLDYGCSSKVCDDKGVPVLAYAIMRSKDTVLNPVDVVKMLVAFGAEPRAIPSDMWENYLEAPSDIPAESKSESVTAWCTPFHREVLAATLNLSIRYFLHKASQLTIAKGRALQIAKAYNYTAPLKVPYLIIGQDKATKLVVDSVATHLGMERKVPLVLVFAGLSGHGKTELAKQMDSLLQIPMTVIDCAQMRSDIALFGSRFGYIGNAQGSQLNNHLASTSGHRNVVFLDEFDKTEQEVHNSLLLVLDSGEYHDRRNNKLVDASKTIWIMATNLGDREITKFYRKHLEGVEPQEKSKAPYTRLTESLKSRFRERFGAPMAGRMRTIAPFFPFDNFERAVVAHKFLMELVEEVRAPINTYSPNLWFPGHVHLNIKNDGKLSAHIAKEAYSEELGARSVISAIDDVRNAFFAAFTDSDELVSNEMNNSSLMRFTAQILPVLSEDGDEEVVNKVSVTSDGFSDYWRGDEDEMDVDTMIEELEGSTLGELEGNDDV